MGELPEPSTVDSLGAVRGVRCLACSPRGRGVPASSMSGGPGKLTRQSRSLPGQSDGGARILCRCGCARPQAGRVHRLFGIPGGGANLDLIEAAAGLGIGFTLAHTESAACIMASTFGRLTGTAGVAVVTRGPGLTSAANGLARATLDRFPLLLLADGVPHEEVHRTAHQRLDQVRMAAPLAKQSGVLGWQEPSATVAAAAALACRPPAGAVHLTLDRIRPRRQDRTGRHDGTDRRLR